MFVCFKPEDLRRLPRNELNSRIAIACMFRGWQGEGEEKSPGTKAPACPVTLILRLSSLGIYHGTGAVDFYDFPLK